MDIDGVLIAVPTQLNCFREGEGRGRQGKYMAVTGGSTPKKPEDSPKLTRLQQSLKGYADPLDAC